MRWSVFLCEWRGALTGLWRAGVLAIVLFVLALAEKCVGVRGCGLQPGNMVRKPAECVGVRATTWKIGMEARSMRATAWEYGEEARGMRATTWE